MTIDLVDISVTSPGRNFVTLKITTSDGVVGWGDATLNGRELSVASYLRDHVASTLVGRDEDRIEDTWQYLYRAPYWRRGPVTMAAIAAVDMALWDIKAKKAGMPLYQLLGGASRDALRVYVHASGADYASLHDAVSAYVDSGVTAVRVQTGIPGLGQIYGVATNKPGAKYNYEPAKRAADGSSATRPVEESWDTRKYLAHMPGVFARLREDFGTDLRILHDGHHRMSPIEAARFAKDVEPYDLFWLEDCTPGEDQSALRLVRQHSTTPLAIGEVFNTVYDYQTLITERLIDYVRSAVTHTGGITSMKKLLDFAAVYGIKSGIHGPTDISPVGMAAALHLGLAIHNFGIQEYMPHSDTTLDVFRTSYTYDRGFLHPGEAPGLGVELDEAAAGAFEYTKAYLPVNRLTDGTMHDW
ncbi:D-mannonate dehydratase ManD [Microbacterium imperiale]|uniref:D-mannonate dehydratase n=1 Tax=Microbacterium imperiale TaxID=33884 RepID=A0A9W6M474_9MICO|nr:D-mannonate dehydratase ManD [Microbacterium imperiale]MBP2421572.1 mannonate dehydratase [Microbacterium imperiale]MDS0199323.1 D-galactonate dehydratase family protein [Microbacterium imperiale]BFE41913.1 D-galactonate dehydratase family protein [Microbacterium imperiale]GLJ80865.1 D-mannonate dehydratase [Microbacterium imperiale]